VRNMGRLERELLAYRYSSFPDYAGLQRPLRAILSNDGFDTYRDVQPRTMLENARAYYADLAAVDPQQD